MYFTFILKTEFCFVFRLNFGFCILVESNLGKDSIVLQY